MKQLTVIVFAAVLLISCNNTQAPVSADEYLIAYNIHVPDTTKDDWDILVTNFNGTVKKNITGNDDVAWTYHAWKNRLFFISDRDTSYRSFFLYEMDADGNNVKKLSNLQLEDSWMSTRKDGDEVLVTGRIGKEVRYQLFIIDTKTGGFRQITHDTAARYGDPCFSPDGKQIVLSYKKNRRDRTAHEELYLMNDDGTHLTQLTYYPENNPSAQENGYKAGAARWHPTENFISYVSLQDGRHSLFAITPDGKKQWKLIGNPMAETYHDWSPDGKWLAYSSADIKESRYDITLMNWQTKEKKQLTDSSYKTQLGPVFIKK
jgi:TolB protein